MTRDQAKRFLELEHIAGARCIHPDIRPAMRAWADGKEIEFRLFHHGHWSSAHSDLSFDPACAEYRVTTKTVTVKCDGKTVEISKESAKALGLCD